MDTRKLHPAEIKPLLKEQARKDGIDLGDRDYALTFWPENGTQGFSACEEHSANEREILHKMAERGYKTRVAILNAVEDRLIVYSCEIQGATEPTQQKCPAASGCHAGLVEWAQSRKCSGSV
jgi:hypothetical protein